MRLERKERSDKITPETIEKVQKFYLDEKNSRILPGKKDMISVKTKDGRVKLTKQLLLSTIPEAYYQFVEENGKILSLDSFRKLRPPNVVLVGSAGTHTICCCISCENPQLMITTSNICQVEGINALTQDGEKLSAENIIKQLVCSDPTDGCYLSSCEACHDKREDFERKLSEILKAEGLESVEYTQWVVLQGSHHETYLKSVEDFCSDFVDSMTKFKTHHFIHSKQSKYLYELKTNPPEGTILIWMDYAENYACTSTNEVQQAYFKKLQVDFALFVLIQVLLDKSLKIFQKNAL